MPEEGSLLVHCGDTYWDGVRFTPDFSRALCYPDAVAALRAALEVMERTGTDCRAGFFPAYNSPTGAGAE
jgi:hypothetical protein